MNLHADTDLGAGLRLRTLTDQDVDLLVEATSGETSRALWDAHPRGPYSAQDAQLALQAWDPRTAPQVSYGILDEGRLLGALGLMPDGPRSAELTYWIRPESRRQGLALRGIRTFTSWAHSSLDIPRIWLEINPDNTPSQRLAERADYRFEQRLPAHCRTWSSQDPAQDTWHDCLIWSHTARNPAARGAERP